MKLLKIVAIGALTLAVAGAAQARPPRRPMPVFQAQLALYEGPNFVGDYRIVRGSVPRMVAIGFNDRASSLRATGQWQVCSNPNYTGRCFVVRGGYAGLGGLQLSDKISSVRYVGP
jgi:hypothetical protein